MFSISRGLRAISPYSVFMMDNKSNPSLSGMAVTKRGRLLAKMYKKLSRSQINELKQRAEAHPNFKRASSKSASHHTAANGPFSQFVKENYDKVRCLNYSRRLSALARLYEIQKPISIHGTVIKGPNIGDVISGDDMRRRLQNVLKPRSAGSRPHSVRRASHAHPARRAASRRPAHARRPRRSAGVRSSQSRSARSRVKAHAYSSKRSSSKAVRARSQTKNK